MQNVQLVLTAELAADYFSLRELDAETQVVQDSITIEKKGLDLVNNRHEGGVASGLDLAQQQTLLDATTTQLYLVQQQRATFEHAIAVLTGTPAGSSTRPEIPIAPISEHFSRTQIWTSPSLSPFFSPDLPSSPRGYCTIWGMP